MVRKIILFLTFICHFTNLFPQYLNREFDHISSNKGFSGGDITSIIQDRKGYVWVATGNGLNRFNGVAFTIYKNDPEDAHSISSNHVLYVLEDSLQRIWACTDKGLNLYDRGKDRFIHFNHKDDDTASIGDNLVQTIFADRSGKLWIGHFKGFSEMVFGEGDIDNNRGIRFINQSNFRHTTISKKPERSRKCSPSASVRPVPQRLSAAYKRHFQT